MNVVVMLSAAGCLGGAERSVVEQASAANGAATTWEIVSLEPVGGVIADLCRSMDVRFVRFDSVLALLRHVHRTRPDVVYAFGFRWSIICRVARVIGFLGCGDQRALLLSAQRGLDVWRRPVHNIFDRATQFLVDAYVSNSHAAEQMLVERVGINAARVKVIEGGLASEWLRPIAARSAIGRSACKIMLVGNNRPEKAYSDAILILAGLDDLSWTATIFADTTESIGEMIQSHGLEERVGVVQGRRLEPIDYDEFDVFLHCAWSESYPRAVLEAHARGLLVVATNTGDVSRMLGVNDMLFEPGSVTAARDRLRSAIAAKPSVEQRTISDVRTIEMVAAEFEQLLVKLHHDCT
jgi:glycosyltransferase involved in cell wall biosynthesis